VEREEHDRPSPLVADGDQSDRRWVIGAIETIGQRGSACASPRRASVKRGGRDCLASRSA
ncbi:hypothetical protein BCR44DRAFT_37946, partial [Catenaria anguillulae PL171]